MKIKVLILLVIIFLICINEQNGYYYSKQGNSKGKISPCVDASNRSSKEANLHNKTTSPTGELDSGRLDYGFHHSVGAPPKKNIKKPTVTPTWQYTPTETPYYTPKPTKTPVYTDYLYESIKGKMKGWSFNGLWHIVSKDPNDPYYSKYAEVYEGKRAIWYGREESGNYKTGNKRNFGSLISPSVLIKKDLNLIFYSWEQTEGTGYSYDTRKVYISTDGGEYWEFIYSSTDNSSKYHKVSIDLHNYIGLIVKFKFEFDTVDGKNNEFRGWYLDKIYLEERKPVK